MVGTRGLGDGENSYPQAMAFYKGKLYVGMTRNSLTLHMRPTRVPPPPKYKFFPVRVPLPMPPERMCGEIWRYDPEADHWKMVMRAPLIQDEQGNTIMREVGYRSMVVYHGRSTDEPALYATSMSPTGVRLLRCIDGENFEEVGPPGLCDSRVVSVRSIIEWRGKLYFTPAGTRGVQGNETAVHGIFEGDDPENGVWRQVCPPAFGDEGNKAVAELAVFDGHLYASTLNPISGFQLWKTKGEGEPPYEWTLALSAGGHRGFLNEGAISLCEFGGALYLGTGIAGGGYNRLRRIGPAASELLRIFPDDTWDLIMGAPRMTPAGLKLPLSGIGPGFNNPLNGYTWRMCAHDGSLYVGTYNIGVWFPYLPMRFPEELGELLQIKDLEELSTRFGGCHVWRSHDGEHFSAITTDGFGTPYNFGVRQIQSTPIGLVVGTANPFGPDVGVKRDGEWVYEPNPRGGVEIWVGSREYQGEKLQVIQPRDTSVTHQRGAFTEISQVLIRWLYGQITMDFYGGSGFTQMGYWEPETTRASEACERLVEKLIALVPDRRGPILEVTCGPGATTEVLARHFPEERITAIDVIPLTLDFAKRRLPDATFRIMSPTRLDFPDASFKGVLCIESPFTFNTRKDFLREAYRVLEPGGQLALSDVLFSRTGEALNLALCRQNHLRDSGAYERLLKREGWKNVSVVDATAPCAAAYQEHIARHVRERFHAGAIGEGDFNTLMAVVTQQVLFLRHYVLVSATKL